MNMLRIGEQIFNILSGCDRIHVRIIYQIVRVQEEKQSAWRLSEELVRLQNEPAEKKKKDAAEQKRKPDDERKKLVVYNNNSRKPIVDNKARYSLRGMGLDIELVVRM
jgi:hypothetical protein